MSDRMPARMSDRLPNRIYRMSDRLSEYTEYVQIYVLTCHDGDHEVLKVIPFFFQTKVM